MRDQEYDARDMAERFLHHTVEVIDAKFGKGYAAQHPELVAGYMLVAQQGFTGERLAEKLNRIAERTDLSDEISELSSNLYQGLHEIAHAFTCGTEISLTGLSEVADAIDPTGKHQQYMAQFYKAEEEERAKRKANGAVGKDGVRDEQKS